MSVFAIVDEDFDSMSLGPLSSDEWITFGTDTIIQSNKSINQNALLIREASLTYNFNNSNSLFWLSFFGLFESGITNNISYIDESASAVFFVNSDNNLVVYSNQLPLETDYTMPFNEWMKFDLFCDYDVMKWSISVNNSNIIADLPFYSNSTHPSQVFITNGLAEAAFIDSFFLSAEEPVGKVIDTDLDSLPDWWELKYYQNITNAVSSSENIHSYIAGLSKGELFRITFNPINWESKPGRMYSIYATTNLLESYNFVTNLTEGPFTQGLPNNTNNIFYKLELDLNLN